MSTNNKKYSRQYYAENKEKMREYQRQYRLRNKEKIKKYDKCERPKNSKSERNKKYWKNNKKQLLDYHRKYQKDRSKVDPEYKMKRNLRSRLYKVLKGRLKTFSSIDALGCSVPELRVHLENQWEDGMSWENYGEWHIDHIKPCSSFDLSSPCGIKKCFHFSNLQPLWEEDNLRKSAKILN